MHEETGLKFNKEQVVHEETVLKFNEEQVMQLKHIASKISSSVSGLIKFQSVTEKVYEQLAFNIPKISSMFKKNDQQARSMLGMRSDNDNGQGNIKKKIDGMVINSKFSMKENN